MRTFLPLLAVAAIVPCASAQEADDSGWYAGLSYEYMQENNLNFNYSVLNLTGGYDFSRSFGVELSASTGIEGDTWHQPSQTFDDGEGGTITTPDFNDKGELSYRVDLMGVARIPVTERVRLVGKLGVSQYEFKRTISSTETPDFPSQYSTESLSGTGLVGSLGGEIDLTGKMSLSGAFNHYEEQGALKGDVEGFQIALKRRF